MLRQVRQEEIALKRAESAAVARATRRNRLADEAEVKARLANVPVEGWDKTVLGAVIALNQNAHDEAILKTLRRAGHPSLSEGALLRPLKRLEERGLLSQQRAARGEGKRARTLRFWVSAV